MKFPFLLQVDSYLMLTPTHFSVTGIVARSLQRLMEIILLSTFIILGILTGVFWTLAYISIIVKGVKDRTYGMPIVALCANISWEFIFTIIFPHRVPQLYINATWLILDTIIFIQLLRLWKSEFPILSSRRFYFSLLVALITSFCLVLLTSLEFDDFSGVYTAFGQNLMMSILFVLMFLKRDDLRGQTIYIALFKMLGSAASSLGFWQYGAGYLLPFLCIAIFLFDLTYVVLILQKRRQLGNSIWQF